MIWWLCILENKEVELEGDFGVWLVIYVELATFGALFIGYAIARSFNEEVFNASQLFLDKNAGFINTILLITASFFVIKAVEIIQNPSETTTLASSKASKYLLVAIALGAVFIILKITELTHIFSQGIHLSTNTFFTFYILLAVFHWMHVALGLFVLVILYQNTKAQKYTQKEHTGLLSGGLYWHMVDLLWIVLFPLVYLMR